jgi:hypothetical protein
MPLKWAFRTAAARPPLASFRTHSGMRFPRIASPRFEHARRSLGHREIHVLTWRWCNALGYPRSIGYTIHTHIARYFIQS